MAQNLSEEVKSKDTSNTTTNATAPQSITYITNVDPGQQSPNRIPHRRTISIVSQSTISADVFLTPQSIRHEDFVKRSWLDEGHKRSASASSFFSVVSEKDKKANGLKDKKLRNTLIVDVSDGYLNGTEADYSHQNRVIKDSITREQYWACSSFSSREKMFALVILILTLIILVLLAVIIYMHYGSNKNINKILPQLTLVQR